MTKKNEERPTYAPKYTKDEILDQEIMWLTSQLEGGLKPMDRLRYQAQLDILIEVVREIEMTKTLEWADSLKETGNIR